MVRHIVMWNFKEGLSDEEKEMNARRAKDELEALAGIIPGVVSLRVVTPALESGNRVVVLNSLFASEEALAAYQVHPEHVRVSGYIGTVMTDRACADYFE